MITPEGLREVWFELEMAHPPPDGFRVAASDVNLPSGHPLFAIDAEQHRHVLIPVRAGQSVHEDTRSAGVHIVARELMDTGRPLHLVDIVCRKPHLHELFSIIAGEMLELLEENADEPDKTCAVVLQRWRELLEHEPTGLPPIEKLVGIFGELWHLREITRINPFCTSCWIGPSGARHDFRSGNIALEVKATLVRHGRFFEIHGHEQLEPPEDGRLYLATMKLELVQANGESIPDVVDAVAMLGTERRVLLNSIAAAGLNPADLESCRTISFRPVETRIYPVDVDFPRITSASFVEGHLPGGVLKLTYMVDLTAEPPFPLDNEQIQNLYYSLGAGVI